MHFLWDLSKKIKKDLPNSILLIGGYHAMRQPQETLLKSEFDIVIKSTNVDFVMLELCKELKSKKLSYDDIDTKGITYRKKSFRNDIIDNGSFNNG